MAEKKIQETLQTQEQPETEKPKDPPMEKQTPVPVAIPVPEPIRPPMPSFTKTSPNDLYRKLLPAVLFVLTFVTVMTMLLIYMDTVALGAQQFRANMSRDYELASIPQQSAALVAYVRQLHLKPRPPARPSPPPPPTERSNLLMQITRDKRNGTFVEFLATGGRDPTALYLEGGRGWRGLVVRAAPRDFLALRGHSRTLHACLSPHHHPREISYPECAGGAVAFRSRVLCLPLYTVLAAAGAARADYVLLGGRAAPQALQHLPYASADLRLRVIDLRSSDLAARNATTELLTSKNYTIAAEFDDGIMYALKEDA